MKRLLALAGLVFIVQCGGGGGSSPTAPSGPPSQPSVGEPPGSSTTPPNETPPPPPPPPPASPPPPPVAQTATFVGAGDIAVCGSPSSEATARLLDQIPGTVFTLGDNAYDSGSERDFRQCYDPTWGRHKTRTRPSPGNHDYQQPNAGPYFSYFGDSAGPAGLGYYSYTVGSWHVISLNSNIPVNNVSAQTQWLRLDLARTPPPPAGTAGCTLAYFHHPLFTSSRNGPQPYMREIWEALYEFGVDVVLSGHDHNYERFAPQRPDGAIDRDRGIRQFVAGTGGASLYAIDRVRPNSEERASVHGVLKMTLKSGLYDWEFVPIAGERFRDVGSDRCH